MSTITDVAKKAGVSIATVSRYVNGKADGNMNEETKRKIDEAIRELNYEPNSIARSLKSKETKTIGLVVPDIVNPFFPLMVRGVEDFLRENGYSVFLCNTDQNSQEELAYLKLLQARKVDGIILVGVDLPSDVVLEYIADTPFVCLERHENTAEFDVIYSDNYQGAYDATKYLIDLGAKEIVHIAGRENSKVANLRKQAFIQCLADHEITSDPSILNGSFRLEDGYRLTMELIEQRKNIPDAIFYANDFMAFGGIRALVEKEVRIPQDISVIGYDDVIVASLITPALTTVRQPVYEMGKNAAELLLKRIQGTVEPGKQHVLLKPELVIRNSTSMKVVQ
ncbi:MULTISPECIES: LacI family DNA-binding transcriptional regulator [unclassified Paenibacillus]|uniref:LacI family DNA-binding transcriptional regulator n=1 Tax=unclassified Paenibacillus TaxID=185978 RepID=UPI001C10E850|nr:MULTISPECIES: LacI family DNA-binding transcriptional regulator [unclassified Paenibacillus]MBU5444543.1 LacI family transcriptional regulator [Paenibacillus sp. MSJ-34]CAH0120854.1 Ribose operon repressor [Paenibacillus sp. CECT 9249]